MSVPLTHLTVEEYLKAEESSEIRHEYLDGQIFAMSGASREHNLIAGNIFARLRTHLRGSSCRTFISDMKVKIQIDNQKADLFYYPDVVVTCNSTDKQRFFLTSPSLIIEVLSPSTETTDRREKLLNYQKLDSLREYVLVSQDKVKIEVYRKDIQGNWSLIILGKDDELRLDSIGATLTMVEVYEDVIKV